MSDFSSSLYKETMFNKQKQGEDIMKDQAKDNFKRAFNHTIDTNFCNILDANGGTLSYAGGKSLINIARGIFYNKLKSIPVEVEKGCLFSEVLIAPSIMEKARLLRAIIGIGGTIAGTMMILSALAAVLGWGTSVWAAIAIFFTGVSLLGPLLLGSTGMAIIGVAVYFAMTGNDAEKADKFLKALKSNCNAAVDNIWDEYGAELSK